MPLVKADIAAVIKTAMQENMSNTTDPEAAIDLFCNAIAEAIAQGVQGYLTEPTITHTLDLMTVETMEPVEGTIETTITGTVI